MNRLVRAEFRRLFATSLWRWGPLAAIVCGGGFVSLAVLVGPENFDPPMPGVDTEAGTGMVLSMIGLTAIIPALFGATAMTSEYRHKTITYTFLFAPKRSKVLTAKLLTYAIAGAGYGVLTGVSAAAALYAGTAVRGGSVGADPATVAGLLLNIAVALTVYTVLGVGVGALLRNQTTTLLVLGLYLYMVEHTLALIPGFNLVYPYVPGGATAALTDFTLISQASIEITGKATVLLPPLMAALVLTMYALLAAAAAIIIPMRRDVT